MSRTGKNFDVVLKDVHLNWGTVGLSRSSLGKRNEFEAYIPISITNAKVFDIKQGETFECISDDGLFNESMRATGSQGDAKQYGKNLTKVGDMRGVGYWLKDRKKAKPGDTVRILFVDENVIQISLL